MAIDTTRPSIGRIYDFMLGGHHNYEVDREASAGLLKVFPTYPKWARINRWFLQYVAAQWAEQGGQGSSTRRFDSELGVEEGQPHGRPQLLVVDQHQLVDLVMSLQSRTAVRHTAEGPMVRIQKLVRLTFKVRLADGTLVELERWAVTREEAVPHLLAFVALNYPGGRLVDAP